MKEHKSKRECDSSCKVSSSYYLDILVSSTVLYFNRLDFAVVRRKHVHHITVLNRTKWSPVFEKVAQKVVRRQRQILGGQRPPKVAQLALFRPIWQPSSYTTPKTLLLIVHPIEDNVTELGRNRKLPLHVVDDNFLWLS